MTAIYKRELGTYCRGPVGYIFTAALLVFAGIYTVIVNLNNAYPTFEFTLYNMNYIYFIVTPILTMRGMAEERRQKTIDLLYSLPLKLSGVVLGKYFALLTVLAVPCAVFCLYPLILSLFGHMDFLTAYSSIFAFFLLGAALAAVGLFMSSLTENQIIAAILSFAAVLAAYLMPGLAYLFPSTAYGSFVLSIALILLTAIILRLMMKNTILSIGLAVVGFFGAMVCYILNPAAFSGLMSGIIRYLAVFEWFTPFIAGIFDVAAVVYFATFAALFLFFSILSLEKRRWS